MNRTFPVHFHHECRRVLCAAYAAAQQTTAAFPFPKISSIHPQKLFSSPGRYALLQPMQRPTAARHADQRPCSAPYHGGDSSSLQAVLQFPRSHAPLAHQRCLSHADKDAQQRELPAGRTLWPLLAGQIDRLACVRRQSPASPAISILHRRACLLASAVSFAAWFLRACHRSTARVSLPTA